MKNSIKALALSVASIICFAISANAQKVAVAVVDQHYAAQTDSYKFIMAGLGIAYVVYVVLHNKRRKEVNQFLGKAEVK